MLTKSHFHNRAKLRELLTVENYKEEKVYSIVGRMEVLLDYFDNKEKYKSLIPFLKTYYFITKSVVDKYMTYKGYFYSVEELETLDVYFASLYFTQLLNFLEGKEVESPWKTYFDYCKDDTGVPFLQMLLGINAHINSDLYTSLVFLNYRHHNDFLVINDILSVSMPEVMRYLAFSEHDLYAFTGMVFLKKYMYYQFKNVIVKWRLEAWNNFVLTNKLNKEAFADEIAKRTEDVGKELIAMLHDLPKPFEVFELHNKLITLSAAAGSFQMDHKKLIAA